MKKPRVAPNDVRLMQLLTTMLLAALALLLMLALMFWLMRLPWFAIQGVTVLGDVAHNNGVTLRANVLPRLSGNFFSVDLARTRAAFEALPWVRRAVVRREFPNRLSVTLQEHQAVAFWGAENESRLVNHLGELFEANPGEVEREDLPRLNGPEEQSALVLAMYRALKDRFLLLEAEPVQLELSGAGQWRLQLNSGVVIELGRGTVDEVTQRIERFTRTLSQVSSRYGRKPSALESADLRYEQGYALRLRGVTTTDGQKKRG